MRLVIVTGMSGAGKTTALKMLEDAGFYCVDNLPVPLLEKFTELASSDQNSERDLALGIDIRSSGGLAALQGILQKWKENSFQHSILYLDASDAVLVKRYKETRRNHPLSRNGRVEKGILLERERTGYLRENADWIIDTSELLTRDLRKVLTTLFGAKNGRGSMFVTVLSFGFKYGIPPDADLVFDVRFLPNPYYVEELRAHTGLEAPVRDYVMQDGAGEEYLVKLLDLLRFLLPRYDQEGKNQLVIAIGCTGGRHRSVAIASAIAEELTKDGAYEIRIEHRDAFRDGGH